jgi:Skp family chaperone for outer membrane proteins
MKRSLFFNAMACLAASFSSVCFAQDHATDESNKLTREEWQSRVNATRERLNQQRDELRLEREKQLGPKREELRLDREERIEPKQEALRRDRENRFGAKQEELRRDREKRIEPKRDELRREREKQKDLQGLNWRHTPR